MINIGDDALSVILENIEKDKELYLQIVEEAPKNEKMICALEKLGVAENDMPQFAILIAGMAISYHY
ncbi:hypothetical protein PGRAN_02450 [Listeria grandensis FSL F6-0971]|uniref:Uncharacterized protein n=1 Tax=Listeria grandensis FSL F6-0971 TaxID=1265819 RepID=W7BC66_9LIST|nr:hypothetical protein [Listeria grandensis]EUJ24719.1 hypothetical protein PGRAN_02450 [Listeria grandensis FSL F6-0971]